MASCCKNLLVSYCSGNDVAKSQWKFRAGGITEMQQIREIIHS